jgi:hypothetical protein
MDPLLLQGFVSGESAKTSLINTVVNGSREIFSKILG